MGALVRHWPRILVTLLPLVVVLMHAVGVVRLGVLDRLDNIIFDSRLRATMPKTLDDRIVIIDIDEKSLADIGRWPWGRNRLSDCVTSRGLSRSSSNCSPRLTMTPCLRRLSKAGRWCWATT